MANEKNDPPKANDGPEIPALKKPAEAAGSVLHVKPDPESPLNLPAGESAKPVPPAKLTNESPATPAVEAPPKPPATVTAKPAAIPSAPGAPAKPAVPPKPAAAPKAPIKPDPWSSPLLEKLQKEFPDAITEAVIFRSQPSLNIAAVQVVPICEFLKSPEGGAYTLLTDETAVDFPKREKRFDVVYHLYSFEGNDRLRLRVQAGAGDRILSVTSVWPTANWMEREIFDMFGIEFEGHPNLKRILMPDDWVGHPLRKDYDILKQDVDWVKKNLGIESGQ